MCLEGDCAYRSAPIYPLVTVITNRAPRINGGAGDGIPNAQQANPSVNANTRPITGFIVPPIRLRAVTKARIRLLLYLGNSQPRLHSSPILRAARHPRRRQTLKSFRA